MIAVLSGNSEKLPVRKKRRFRRLDVFLTALLFVLFVSLALYLRSDSFRDVVRRKVVAELERTTGGKVELQSFTWRLSRLEFEARGLTIHGLENQDQVPYVHADRLFAQAQIVSLFSRKFGMHLVTIDHPVIHLIVYSNGTTNQPRPKIASERNEVEALLDLAVGRLQVNNGELLVNDKKIPFELAGERLNASMKYLRSDNAYEGNASIASLSMHYGNFRPLPRDLDVQFLLRRSQAEIKALKFNTGRSILQAEGTVTDFNNPDVRLKYTGSFDLAEIGKTAKLPQLQAGRLD